MSAENIFTKAEATKDSTEKDSDDSGTKQRIGKAAVKPKKIENPKPAREQPDERLSWFEDKKDSPKPKESLLSDAHPEADDTPVEIEPGQEDKIQPGEIPLVVPQIAEHIRQNSEIHDLADNPGAAAAEIPVEEYLDRLEHIQPGEDPLEIGDEIIQKLGGDTLPADSQPELDSLGLHENDLEGEPLADPLNQEWVPLQHESSPADALDPDDEEAPATSVPSGPSGAAGGHNPAMPNPGGGGFGPPGPPNPAIRFGNLGGPLGPGGPIPNFNAAPAAPARAPQPVAERIDHRGSPAAFFVAGGIVGYIIGKRRWKRKTREELIPVQKKLEKQVEDMHWQIKAKESQIRKVAAEKVRQQGPGAVEALAIQKVASTERQKETAPAIGPETIKETRQKAPEAQHLHAPKAPEHIAQVLMAGSEALPAAPVLLAAERAMQKPDKIKQASEKPAPIISEKSVETLSRAELLQLSEQIKVEGSSLRQIYETNLLGERGLRRLVAEHLRGGDMAKALKQEITEREIDFERDPAMRDIAPSGLVSGGGTSSPTLDQMVQQAAAKLPAAHEEAAFYKARAAYEVEQSTKSKQRQQVIDASFAGVIVILLAAVCYLFITRG